ncbi:MAG: DNA mismatch repair protein MutS [Planctomycetota bacterium]|jgi:DNA mismatch repair protein MutS
MTDEAAPRTGTDSPAEAPADAGTTPQAADSSAPAPTSEQPSGAGAGAPDELRPAPAQGTPKAPRSTAGASKSASAKGKAGRKGQAPGVKARGKGSSPMMEQFWRAKDEQPNALLFFRMGDFYEMFGDDAVVASRELGIALTSRDKGDEALPMAGVPVRAAEGHLLRLVRKGYRVAICEQLSDPKQTKGIVDRGIVRVVTAGTLTEEDALDARASNYLTALTVVGDEAGLAWADVSTGRLHVAACAAKDVGDWLARIQPAELLCAPEQLANLPELAVEVERSVGPRMTEREGWRFDRETGLRIARKHFGVQTLEGFGVEHDSPIVPAAGALLEYLAETQKTACDHIRRMERAEPREHLTLDRATRTCLELVETQRGGRREGTVLEVLDRTQTPMGGRLLREWLLAPLAQVDPILHRQRAVAELVEQPFRREELRTVLSEIRDLERLVAKLSTGRLTGRDLLGLALSTKQLPPLRTQLEGVYSAYLDELGSGLDPLEDVTERILGTLVDDPPTTIKEGGLIRAGLHPELDEFRGLASDGKQWMARFQAEEIEKTGIQALKLGFNSVFGYYLEIPRGQADQAPDRYIRKQTLKNAERYITPELKEFETKVLQAEDRAKELEYQLFTELKDAVAAEIGRILDSARAVAQLDVLCSLAEAAGANRYAAPTIDEGELLEITGGRHPVIELSDSCDSFVPNDTRLDRAGGFLGVLTGPNMAGKSTYIRQTALIVLMAQIGSFVPADAAQIGIVDRIFTRVGSGDDISRGESTFMVEMVEIANILNNASERSLVVLDEVGRGTSTFDGLALAWSIVEHLHGQTGARTLFATHYHQLTELGERLAGVFNLSVAVREWGDEIVFLHQIIEGGTDRSYGIHVARLAGVPADVLERARQVLAEIESDSEQLAPKIAGSAPPPAVSPETSAPPSAASSQQLALFDAGPSAVEKALLDLNLDSLTPIDALLKLKELRDSLG